MKIIDLLNKIANGEEVPEKVKFNGYIFEKDLETDYICYAKSGEFKYLLNEVFLSQLNDEIEIIEEDKEIEIPKHIPNEVIQDLDRVICPDNVKCIAHKVNELINYLQHINKGENNE